MSWHASSCLCKELPSNPQSLYHLPHRIQIVALKVAGIATSLGSSNLYTLGPMFARTLKGLSPLDISSLFLLIRSLSFLRCSWIRSLGLQSITFLFIVGLYLISFIDLLSVRSELLMQPLHLFSSPFGKHVELFPVFCFRQMLSKSPLG